MKKLMFLILAFGFFFTFAQEPICILKKDLILEDMFLEKHKFLEGENFFFDYAKTGFGVDIDDPLKIEITLYDINGSGYSCDINDVYLTNYSFKLNENIKKDYWIPSYYYEVLKSSDAKKSLLSNEPYWKNKPIYSRYDNLTWIDEFGVLRYYFDDFYFVIFGNSGYYDVDFFAYLEEVSDNKIIYNVQKMYSHFLDYNRKQMAYPNQPEFLPLFEKEIPFKIILSIDGDYMNVYVDEISEKTLFQTLVCTTPEACNQIENWIKEESNDLSKVKIPKNRTASSNIEATKVIVSNVTKNKSMLVTENLKLRSGEAISTQVLTVMAAGTKVKILELGKAETIDGISSNWVKVEVQADAKDRNGKPIKKGTVGWCYGGYLK